MFFGLGRPIFVRAVPTPSASSLLSSFIMVPKPRIPRTLFPRFPAESLSLAALRAGPLPLAAVGRPAPSLGQKAFQQRTQATAASTSATAPSPVFAVDTPTAAEESGPLPLLDKLIKNGTFRNDERQKELTSVLQELHEELIDYEPEGIVKEEAPSALFSRVGLVETSDVDGLF